jgi:hypothetical protein
MGWMTRTLPILLGLLFVGAMPAGAQSALFDNSNTGGVQNNGQSPTFTLRAPAHISQLITYHWNGGRGAPPGSIGLRSSSGQTFGPFPAQGSSGQGGAPNVNWIANPNVTVPAGNYTVTDSNPGTWSQNGQSGGRGFAKVYGNFQAAGAPAPGPIPLPGGITPVRPPVPPPPPPAVASGFRPCFVNAGSVAAMGPCQGPIGTPITIQLSRSIKSPIAMVVFKPFNVALPGAVGAAVTVRGLSGGTKAGSQYHFNAPAQLCISKGGGWDAFPNDATGQGLGDIGRFTIINCP